MRVLVIYAWACTYFCACARALAIELLTLELVLLLLLELVLGVSNNVDLFFVNMFSLFFFLLLVVFIFIPRSRHLRGDAPRRRTPFRTSEASCSQPWRKKCRGSSTPSGRRHAGWCSAGGNSISVSPRPPLKFCGFTPPLPPSLSPRGAGEKERTSRSVVVLLLFVDCR